MAIKSFKSDTARDLFLGDNTKAARRIARQAWTAAIRRLAILHSTAKLADLAQIPGLRFEALKHHRPGFYSIRVNDQYRITFRFEDGDAYEVEVEDPRYHQP